MYTLQGIIENLNKWNRKADESPKHRHLSKKAFYPVWHQVWHQACQKQSQSSLLHPQVGQTCSVSCFVSSHQWHRGSFWDQSSMQTSVARGTEVGSMEGASHPDKELGLCSPILSWLSHSFNSQQLQGDPQYIILQTQCDVEVHNGCMSHFFPVLKEVQDSDRKVFGVIKTSWQVLNFNLHHHALHCFGEDTVNTAVKGRLVSATA